MDSIYIGYVKITETEYVLFVFLIQGKASDIDGVKLHLTEVEKERDVHNETIGKLKQVN